MRFKEREGRLASPDGRGARVATLAGIAMSAPEAGV